MAVNSEHYDLVIAGGGMIGSSLAVALAPLGLRIAVVEAVARGDSWQPSFDDRSTGLSRSSQRMFEAVGLWAAISRSATPIMSIHVSDRGRFGFTHIDAREQGVEALGYVVINRNLGDVLHAAMMNTGGLEFICPAKINTVELSPGRAVVGVERAGGRRDRLYCKLLVAADGANSTVRNMVGITASKRDYRQIAVVGNLQPEKPPGQRAYERFTPDGPIAMLPLADERAAFVWSLCSDKAEAVKELPVAEFAEHLQAAFGTRLGRFTRVGTRVCYPLTLSKASRLISGRCVLVGNAAHGLHPVSAQGFNLGLRDVAALSDCIADVRDGVEASPDIGRREILARYARWRRADQRKLVGITDGIVRVFGSSSAPVPALRDLGMLGLDLVPGMRSLFARQMMGLTGRLPRLSRGVPLK